jgi:hypothetical protein
MEINCFSESTDTTMDFLNSNTCYFNNPINPNNPREVIHFHFLLHIPVEFSAKANIVLFAILLSLRKSLSHTTLDNAYFMKL